MKHSLMTFFAIMTMFGAYVANAQEQSPPAEETELQIYDFDTIEVVTTPGGLTVQPVFLSDVRLVQVTLEAGQTTTSHSHEFEQMVTVLSGKIKAFNDDEEFILEPGQGFAAASNVHHYYTALEDSVTLEVIGPGAPVGGGMGGAMGGGMGGGDMGGDMAGGMGGGMGPASE